MESKSKIWYSYLGGQSEDDHLGYYDNKNFPWVKLLEDNFDVIKKEIQGYIEINEENIKPYFNSNLVAKEKSWRTFTFLVWGWKVKKNIKQCPKTAAIINQIPNIVSYSVSIMEPGAEIKPHRGDTNAIVRSHLGLVVNDGLPNCGFRVVETNMSWEEGKVITFNDAAWHKAWNLTDNRRYVLLVDVMRSEFVKKKYSVCSTVLGVLVRQSIFQKVPILQRLPKGIKNIFLYFYIVVINLVLRIRNVLNI